MSTTWKVEMAFGDDAMETSPTWTDVSQYVRLSDGMSLRHGRRSAFSRVSPGIGMFTLDNRDGRFTPGYTSGAYYPDIKRHVPVRVTATRNGTTYPRFRGWATKWAPALTNGVDANSIVSFEMTDLFGVLDKKVIRSRITETAKANGNYVHWPLWETGDKHTVDLFTPDGDPLDPYLTFHVIDREWGGALFPGDTSGPDGETSHLRFEPKAADSGLKLEARAKGITYLDAYEFTIYLWVNAAGDPWGGIEGNDPSFPCEVLRVGTNYDAAVQVLLGTNPDPALGGSLVVQLDAGTENLYGGYISHHAESVRMDSEPTGWSSVVIRCSGNASTQTIDLFVNGVETDSWSGSTLINFQPYYWRLGGIAGYYYFVGSLAHVGMSFDVWTDDQITEFHRAGWKGHRGEKSGARIERILSWVDLPNGYTLDEGISRMGPLEAAGKSVATLLQDVAETEAGIVWTDGAGKVRFQSRSLRRRPYASPPEVPLENIVNLQPVLDRDSLSDNGNVVIATHADTGAQFITINETSVATYGEFSVAVTVHTDSYHEARARSQWQANNEGDGDLPKWGDLAVDISVVSDAVAQAILSIETGWLIQITPPTKLGPTANLWVEGISERVQMGRHIVVLHTSPATTENVWYLGDSVTGKLTSTTPVLAY